LFADETHTFLPIMYPWEFWRDDFCCRVVQCQNSTFLPTFGTCGDTKSVTEMSFVSTCLSSSLQPATRTQ
jgi:hypothetical protein